MIFYGFIRATPASILSLSPLHLQSDSGTGIAVKERTDQLFKLLPGINVPNNIDLVLVEPAEVDPYPVD